jgi:hypothetical protein
LQQKYGSPLIPDDTISLEKEEVHGHNECCGECAVKRFTPRKRRFYSYQRETNKEGYHGKNDQGAEKAKRD